MFFIEGAQGKCLKKFLIWKKPFLCLWLEVSIFWQKNKTPGLTKHEIKNKKEFENFSKTLTILLIKY